MPKGGMGNFLKEEMEKKGRDDFKVGGIRATMKLWKLKIESIEHGKQIHETKLLFT